MSLPDISNIESEVRLVNGESMPVLGFGVWDSPQNLTTKSCLEAFKVGYRHIDTAQGYSNETEVGAALKESGLKRSDVFVTTKIWKAGNDAQETYDKLADSVRKIAGDGSDAYVDLILIHSATPGLEGCKLMWQAMEKLHKEGKIKSLGVSNFDIGHIESLQKHATVWPPTINQLELHPWLQQEEVDAYCQKNKIIVQAYCPIVRNKKADDATLKAIAEKNSKSTTQVLLRYCLQKNWVPLPKSDNPTRIRQNAEIFDFALDDDDMQKLNGVPQEKPLVVAVNTMERW